MKSFFVLNKMNLRIQANIWKKYLPFIYPFYAIKSNNDMQLLCWMTEVFYPYPVGFDCASINEMKAIRSISNSSKIIYAHPCKTKQDIITSAQLGVDLTVVDSPEEMQKLHDARWRGNVLSRLAVPDTYSKQPFSKKFGAPIQWIPTIFDLSKRYNIPIKGLSFHVGSECNHPEQFSQALQLCHQVMNMGIDSKMKNMDIIDIGGGFLIDNLPAIALCITSSIRVLFPRNESPDGTPIFWIAEPGRFLSATCQTLYTSVIGRKYNLPSDDMLLPKFRYTLNDSVYGSFSNILLDGQKPTFTVAYQQMSSDTKHRSILFGHTCDGADVINSNIELPLLNVGDWLQIANMGAYTNVTASEFNGFPKSEILYIDQ